MEKFYKVRNITDLKDLLTQSCALYKDKPAFLIKNKGDIYSQISYNRFGNDVEYFGTALLKLGLCNSSIAVLGENRYEWCVSYLSTVNGVGTVVPLDKELPANEITNLLERSEATAIIFSGKYRNQIKMIKSTVNTAKVFIDMDAETNEDGILSFYELVQSGKQLVEAGDKSYSSVKINSEEARILIFTSGTTDIAKGVMLSHQNICADIMGVCSTVKVNSDDKTLSILPLHHTYECSLGFLAFIYNGAAISFNDGLRNIPKNLKNVKPTVMITVPLLIENIYKKIQDKLNKSRAVKIKFNFALFLTTFLSFFKINLSKNLFKEIHDSFGGEMRLIIVGAAAIKPEVSRFFRRIGIKVLQGYGLTECSPLVAGNRDRSFKDKSCGKAIPGVEIKILKPDNNGIGEILVKGKNVMQGYFRNEKATEKCLSNGWFSTGDLGFMDRKGFLYITGRLKNVIVTKNGKKIFPEEVENYINSDPFVRESYVWGKYDENSGDTVVCAQILPNIEAIANKLNAMNIPKDELTKIFKNIVKTVNGKMPLYKHVKEFTLRENEFLRTTTHKIKRYVEEQKEGLAQVE
ncbi:AMP-dependent synthetase and ligase [Ruminiclostridium papyrosolvens DSM 2782]|uniref:AMP-dependent synthetase and ligase n=1 Tax=Ruminiclostridium papyrosolvens DSM 2782 TaxID=588581 RepID=F1TI41_9FIRM|nr:AMP-binding protein [Ruminiclostridium papyrosolvens]EGD45976.1 AMP-dependent synthetase and ligase [Ruminiclostridium papyrosolvens DSM 2782]WES33635.1 AMP-binding protein [Ruminiclostridium papyrosolvens DSM 2782]